MTIPDRIATALAGVLSAASLPGSPTILSGISLRVLEEEKVAVISNGRSAVLWKSLLAGIYQVSGEVAIKRAIFLDAGETPDSAKVAFDTLCKAVEGIVGQKINLRTILPIQDPALTIYDWNLTIQDTAPMDQELLARYSWAAIARHDPNNPN